MSVSELDRLEAESIHVMREVAAELERPVLMFSGGKDSVVLLRLAEKAFRPGALPFPILHARSRRCTATTSATGSPTTSGSSPATVASTSAASRTSRACWPTRGRWP